MPHDRIDVVKLTETLKHVGVEAVGRYRDSRTPFSCRCLTCGHTWNAYWSNVRCKGCPQCARKKKFAAQILPEAEVHRILGSKSISLDSPYTKAGARHAFQCQKCGCSWKANLSDVLNRHGCPKCSNVKRGLNSRLSSEAVIRFLSAKKIELLSDYKGGGYANVYDAKCLACGHVWKATFTTLRYHACPRCAGVLPKTEQDYQNLAAIYSGTCISRARNTNLKSLWECPQGHRFWRPYTQIAQVKTFCPNCQNNRSEEICRAALEMLFKRPFPKVKIEVKGYRSKLELDGYCAELKVAFEHQGPHHYRPDWRPDADYRHRRTVKLDQLKHRWCAANGVALVVIPELFFKTPLNQLEPIIRSAVATHPAGVAADSPLNLTTLESMPMPVSQPARLKLQQLRHYSAAHGLSLLDEKFTGTHSFYRFQCANGHCFERYYRVAIKTATCPECKKQNRYVQLGVGMAHQRLIRDQTVAEDLDRLARMGLAPPKSASDFELSFADYGAEQRAFVERYEWLGNPGYGIKWCFCARYRGLLGGVVALSEPYRYERADTKDLECLIQRGACAGWTGKNLGSRLIAFACAWMTKNTAKRLFVAYSDPAAGEIGTIYQASNFLYLGQFPKQQYWHNGKSKNVQTLKRTRRLLPWLQKQGITLGSEAFTPKGYFIWSKIPIEIRSKMREHIRTQSNGWHRQESWHGKYVLVKGASRTETKRLLAGYGFHAVPYIKRSSSQHDSNRVQTHR